MNVPFATTSDALGIFSDDPLLFEPDTGFSYSTYGYTLAAAVMEGATGMSFLDILQAQVFDTVGMAHSSADYQDRPVPNRVSDYRASDSIDDRQPAPDTDPSYKWAGGGLLSTPGDLSLFGSALIRGEVVSLETRDVMFTERSTSDGEINPQYYGLGWRMGGLYYPSGTENVIPMINHGGTSLGSTAILAVYPDSGLVVAMTANVTPPRGSGPLRSVAANIARAFLTEMGYVPEGYEAEE